MASQTFSKNWGDGTTDKFYVMWDDSTLPGRASVKVTSDPNYTGEQRSAQVVFSTVGGSVKVTRTLTVKQKTDNLVIAYYGDTVVSMFSDTKAGFPKS
jgi:hypothetical protein